MNKKQLNKKQFNKYVLNALKKRKDKYRVRHANEVINIFTEAVIKALSENDEVLLIGFGKFTKSKVKAKKGRNPRTNEPVNIPARAHVRFKPGIKLKEVCNRAEEPKKPEN